MTPRSRRRTARGTGGLQSTPLHSRARRAVTAPLAAALPLLICAPLPRAAAEPEARITVSAVTPAVLSPGKGLALSGQVTPADGETTVRVTISRSTLSSRSALAAVTTDGSSAGQAVRQGRVLASVTVGARQSGWAVKISGAELGFDKGTRPGVYVIGVGHYRGAELNAATATVAPLPSPSSSFRRSNIIMLWPVTAPPMRTLDGSINNAAMSAALAKSSPLTSMMRAGANSGVAWLVDPALVATMQSAAAGTSGAGTAASSANSRAAAAWMQQMQAVARSQHLAALPAAVPDPTLMREAELGDPLAAAQRAAAGMLRKQLRPKSTSITPVAWPCVGDSACMSNSRLRRLAADGADAIVMRDAYAQTSVRAYSGGGVQRANGSANARLLYTDASLSDAVAGSVDIGSIAGLRQRILGDLALISFERPSRPRTVVATAPLGSMDRAAARGVIAAAIALKLAKASGLINPVQLTALKGLDNDGIARAYRGTTGAVGAAALASMKTAAAARSNALRAALLPASGSDRAQWRASADAMLLATASLLWREDGLRRAGFASRSDFARQFADDAQARRNGVQVLAAGHVWIGTQRGTIPFTLHNTLPVAVRVYPRLASNAPARIRFTNKPASVTLQPGERAGMPTDVTIIGGTAVKVTVEVRDAKGRLISAPQATLVSTSAYARFSVYVVVGAFIILVLLMLNNIRRTIRRRRGLITSDDPNAPLESSTHTEAGR